MLLSSKAEWARKFQRNELSQSQEVAITKAVSLQLGIPEELLGYYEVSSSGRAHKKSLSRTTT